MGNSKDMKFGILDSINKKPISTDSDIISDTNSDVISDINNNITSDTISDISNIIKKKDKYTDIHSRKTYYVEKELLKKIDKLCDRNNLDKSFVVNEALRLFFKEIEKVK
ncbi:hypothetical protein [Clostridium estertheticum]|uniref:Uncharacterized protein n=1 Tax=Clostridium estertheticum TaxID=238834 RepID=A0A7Y3T0S8_9CLOT|nr:hypothetical protein [Clostridium estertheticum]NNU78588.1 hypothetical protein [Clostridium estertheticum]WBL49678.1 hypothetical protein LOR37_23255 [Clostridium estertheticum]